MGATKPEEYGDYFRWGDTVGYKRNSSNNGWVSVKDGTTITFSSSDATAGQTCGKTIDPLKTAGHIDATINLVAQHDAARKRPGEPWRMPMSDEIRALVDNTTTTWTRQERVRVPMVV